MAEYTFTEQAPYEEGFEEVFHDQIVPILQRHEETRKDMKKKATMGMGGAGVVGVGGIGGGVGLENEFGFAAGGLGAVGVFGVKAYFESKWKAGLGGEVLPILCDFLGEMEYGQNRISLQAFERLGVVPNFNTSSTEDAVNGSHDGLDWSMCEAVLKNKSRDSKGRTRTTTVFRGLLFQIKIFGPAPRIFFGKDRGGALNWLSEKLSGSRRGMEKIDVGSPAFQGIYEVYTSDPQAAMRFIDDNLTAGLMEVARLEMSKKYIACAMEGSTLYLALPRKGDFLGLGSLFRPLHTVENDLHEALRDLILPAGVIDKLRGK
ncbi:MAG: DUF3137 domain-containing protein [Pseudomonadota bacterium]